MKEQIFSALEALNKSATKIIVNNLNPTNARKAGMYDVLNSLSYTIMCINPPLYYYTIKYCVFKPPLFILLCVFNPLFSFKPPLFSVAFGRRVRGGKVSRQVSRIPHSCGGRSGGEECVFECVYVFMCCVMCVCMYVCM
jgi:hypothetical protein